jgi:predicted transcriptional regulator
MSKDGYKSVSIDDETDEMLQQIAQDVERRTSVKLDSNHKIIKYLAKKELAKAKAAA